MKGRKTLEPGVHRILAAFLVAALLLGACGPAGTGNGETPLASVDAQDASETAPSQGPAVAESEGFKAEATSPISVQLTWSPVEGATAYEIEGAVGDQEYFRVAELPSELTSYEVFPVPDASPLHFRLTAVAGGSSRDQRMLSLATPEEVPNPYAVGVTLEQAELAFASFDPSMFDPSTFDPSTLDPSLFDPENFDPSSFLPEPAGVTKEVGPEGDSLEATSSNGTIYTLTFPEGALPFTLDLTMTPIASLEGLPDEVELLGAVQIEPEGVPLSAPALLTIDFVDPVGEQSDRLLVGVGFGTGGTDFHFLPLAGESALAFATRGSAKLARPAAIGAGGATMFGQTQSQGMVKASPQAVVRQSRHHAPGDRTRSTRQQAAAAASDPGSAAPTGPSSFEVWTSWLFQEVQKGAFQASKSTGSYQGLLETLSDLEFLLELIGQDLSDLEKTMLWEPMLEAIHARLKEAAEASCMSDAHMYGIQLAERLARPASEFDRELLRRFSEKYGAEGKELVNKARKLAERCPLFLLVQSDIRHFDLDVTSEGHSKIVAEVPLQWRFGGPQRRPYLIGDGPIEYQPAEYIWHYEEGTCLGRPDTVEGSRFIVLRLAPLFKADGTLDNFEMNRYHATGRMRDIIITFAPEETACVEGKQGNQMKGGDLWWASYGAYMLINGGYPIKDWIVRANAGMSTIADKEIIHDGGTIDLGTLTGTTKFILVNEKPE